MNKPNIIEVHERAAGGIVIFLDPEQMKEFAILIHRGINLWPDANPTLKHFADVITNGAPLQDYFSHASNQLKT